MSAWARYDNALSHTDAASSMVETVASSSSSGTGRMTAHNCRSALDLRAPNARTERR